MHAPRSDRTQPILPASGLLACIGMLGGCAGWVQHADGPVSSAERIIYLDALVIMLLIVVPVIIATIGIAWWFRASNTRAHYRPEFTYSGRLELVIWSIPALVVFFLGGIAWISSHELDPAHPLPSRQAPLEIDVVSMDWKWLFIYPQQRIATINELVIPTGVPVRFRITSASVWNVLWIPRLGSMLYCMYGMATTLYLQADHPGVYLGQSAMISGDGFASMHFDTRAVSPDEFSTWMHLTAAAGPVLDEPAYRTLLRPSSSVPPYAYRSVTSGLFDAIVTQKLPAGEGSPMAP